MYSIMTLKSTLKCANQKMHWMKTLASIFTFQFGQRMLISLCPIASIGCRAFFPVRFYPVFRLAGGHPVIFRLTLQ